MSTFHSVDEYIATFPVEVQERLSLMRKTILEIAPEAEEGIAYQMPAYKYHGVLCYFSGYKNHIGFYALPTSHAEFSLELSKYKVGKGSVQFPHSQELPLHLVEKMLKFRMKENVVKVSLKK
jgi:uncharacterized protein YdhG (YjbR/CyaY superfamily)